MSIRLTKINRGGPDGSVTRVRNLLVNMQRDMRNNAEIHKAAATIGSMPLDKCRRHVSDCADSYLRLLGHITAIRADATRNVEFVVRLNHVGLTEADVLDVFKPLQRAALVLKDAPKNTRAEIISACDALLAAVTPHEVDPEKVWEV